MKARFKLNQQIIAPYIFLAPFFILILVFFIFPTFFSLFLSLSRWSGSGGFRTMQFYGLHNFIYLLTEDLYWWKTLGTTAWLLVFGSLSQHFIAIPLAIVLNNKLLRGRDFFRTAFFLPYITSSVSIAIIFNYVFGTNFGFFNFLLTSVGLPKLRWLEDKNLIPVSIAILVNWRYVGWNTVIYLAGMQAIPQELYESADIDGATPLRKHWYITLPLLIPIIFFAVTMSLIGGMQLFDEPYNLTGGYQLMGGVHNAGFTSAYYIMWMIQRAQLFGKAAATCWLLFIIILVMTYINRRITDSLQGEREIAK
jgi:ABC-type sugar transport system permease subunit